MNVQASVMCSTVSTACDSPCDSPVLMQPHTPKETTALPSPQHETTPRCNQTTVTREELIRRKKFCVFLKLLCDDLGKNDLVARRKVKELVRFCTKRNRDGDPQFKDLTGALHDRLRLLVGETKSNQFELRANHLIKTYGHNGKMTAPATTTVKTTNTTMGRVVSVDAL